MESPDQILNVLVWGVSLLFSVIVHENAHGLAAERFGDPTARELGRITMNPIPHIDPLGTIILPALMMISGGPVIGWAKPVPINPSNFRNPLRDDAYVAAVGPLSNFSLAAAGTLVLIVVGLLFKHIPALQDGSGNAFLFFSMLCGTLIQINCLLGIFNLIPVPPLDGHWVLLRYLPSRWAAVLAMLRPYGFFILIVIVIFLGRYVISIPTNFLSGVLFGFYRAVVAAI